MMTFLFFFWNVSSLCCSVFTFSEQSIEASNSDLLSSRPGPAQNFDSPSASCRSTSTDRLSEASTDLPSCRSYTDLDSPSTDQEFESDAEVALFDISKIGRSRSLTTKLTLCYPCNAFTSTDQEDDEEESEFDDTPSKPLAMKRHKSDSPVKGLRISSCAEEASRKNRRLQVSLSSDDLTHTYYGNVIESSHYKSITARIFLTKAFCSLNAIDIKHLLEKLDIMQSSSSFDVIKAESFFGYYTLAIYDIYENTDAMEPTTGYAVLKKKLKYVVKFYNPNRTTFDKIRNLIEVKKTHALRKTNKMIGLLPRLCFHEKLGDLSLAAGENYYFSIHHAAQGELARDVFKTYVDADTIHKLALRAKVLETITAIGESIGSFHCHHGLSNKFSQKSCIDYIRGVALSFSTIIHKDLQPGNIFVDLRPFAENKVTLIDLESMYVSCIKRLSNIDELNYLKIKIAEILDVESEPDFLGTLEEAYQYGIHETYNFYCSSRPTIILSV